MKPPFSFSSNVGAFVDFAPLALVGAAVWIKCLSLNLSMRHGWWTPEMNLTTWAWDSVHAFSATFAILLLGFSMTLLLPRIPRFWALFAFNLFLTALVWANHVHFDIYEDVTSIRRYLSATMLPWVYESVFELLRPKHFLMVIDILAWLAVYPFYTALASRTPAVTLVTRRRVFCSMAALGIGLAVPTAHLMIKSSNRDLFYSTVQREIVSKVGLLPYHAAEFLLFSDSPIREVGETEIARLREFLERERQADPAKSPLFGIARGLNLIVVMSESLQSFPIGMQLEGQPVTPNLSHLASQSLHFVNLYDQTHLGTTSDGEFLALQSLHPLPETAVAELHFQNRFHALPAVLASFDYRSLSAVGAPGDFWRMRDMHRRFGFQRSLFEDDFEVAERVAGWLSDMEFFRQIVPILRVQKKPFFSFLLTSSNHHPYLIPLRDRRLALGRFEGSLFGNYLQSVNYFDRALGQFLQGLREENLLDDSVLVVFGDHQAFLGDCAEFTAFLRSDGRSESEQFLTRRRVPLMIRLPHGTEAGVREVTGGHIDIAPTLLGLLGVAQIPPFMLGKDLARGRDSLVVFRDGSFYDGTRLFINRFGLEADAICHDLKSGRRIECQPLLPLHRTALERLQASDTIIRGDLIPKLASQ